ncbi:hypothetical protein G5B31_12725 [Rhodobacter sp. SGA-6-6]|uniref:bifunctional DNA primase/polymerase n=1 Tax=Rhodobacter sp. SGA-6-6 TaxID=2710882 RepID=UPI0013EB8322|nr:bifunctional DNA primase/polymerase [Rhodobacter sp. SGA-6-6]NGM46399.1 hypothetical protein [Rhodobacter sp. SGA-6-6]
MGVYDKSLSAYLAAGLPVFPVDARTKRPAVKGWQTADARRARGWASAPKLAACDGIGIVMGPPSGLVEIDVDAVGEAWTAAAVDRFGETPITIRTATGKSKLWFRHNGEGRRIRPFEGLPVDVLGAGFTIAPPSWREDLGAAYVFERGGLDDLHRLPCLRAESFERAPAGVHVGERNNALWRYCMTQARHCDDVEALIDVAATWNEAFPDPLASPEAEACARSAWGYQVQGRNFLGLRKPAVTEADRIMDALIDAPDALVLFQMFRRWHRGRPSFAIAPTAMSAAGSPPWHRTRIQAARDVLLGRGFIIEVQAPIRGRRAGQYRFGQMADSGKDHNTPPPLHEGERGQ